MGIVGGDSRSWILRCARKHRHLLADELIAGANHVGLGTRPGDSPLPQCAPEAQADEREDLFAIEGSSP